MIDLGKIKQGERGTLTITWEFPDSLTSPASISGATITAVMENMDTGDVTAVSGTLTATGASTATWALSSGDSGTAGTFHVTFRADVSGTPTYTLNASLEVEENPSVTAVQNDALVGVTSAEAAWVTAGLAAGGAATEDNLASFSAAGVPEDSGVAKTAVGNATKLQARTLASTAPTDGQAVVWNDGAAQWEPGDVSGAVDSVNGETGAVTLSAADVGALPLAGGTMTGGIAYAGNGTLINIAPSADLDHTFMEYAPQPTPTLKWRWTVSAGIPFAGDPTRDDVTMNWGYNQTAQGGRSNAADGSFYLQLENHYWPSGAPAAQYEYHLNAYTSDNGTSYRPFHINVRKDLSYIDHTFTGDSFLWKDRSENNILGFTAGDKNISYQNLDVQGTLKCYTSLAIQSAGGATPSLQISPGTGVVDFTGNPTTTDIRFYNLRKFTLTGFTEFSVTATNNYLYGDVYAIRAVAGTNTPQRVFTAWRTLTTGTAADGIGANFDFLVQTSGGSSSAAGRVRGSWATADTSTRIGEVALEAYDFNSTSAARTGVVVRASSAGTAQLGFYGVTPVARQVLATGASASVDDVITALQNLGLVKQS